MVTVMGLVTEGIAMEEFKGVPFSFDDDDFVIDKNGEVVACLMTMNSAQDASLARLFSAAPELLEALQELAFLYEHDEGCRNLTEYKRAKAAIAKALGK